MVLTAVGQSLAYIEKGMMHQLYASLKVIPVMLIRAHMLEI